MLRRHRGTESIITQSFSSCLMSWTTFLSMGTNGSTFPVGVLYLAKALYSLCIYVLTSTSLSLCFWAWVNGYFSMYPEERDWQLGEIVATLSENWQKGVYQTIKEHKAVYFIYLFISKQLQTYRKIEGIKNSVHPSHQNCNCYHIGITILTV